MQALIELIAGFLAMLAAVALAQFGVDLSPTPKSDREVHRVVSCDDAAPRDARTLEVSVKGRDC